MNHQPKLVFGFLCALSVLRGTCQLAAADEHAIFEREVRPILTRHCERCHGDEEQEAGIRIDTLTPAMRDNRAVLETWNEILHVIDAGEMPPEDETQLSDTEIDTLRSWVSSNVQAAIDARRTTDGRVVLRRLNRAEYQNTMRDLIGLDMDYVRDLPPDAISADGFTNDGSSLQMSAIQLEYYLETARRAMDRLIVSGEAPEVFEHTFTESKIDKWQGNAERSNTLGRQQEFLAKIKKDYPEVGDFIIRVTFTADVRPDVGYPLLEASLGYCPDTQILIREFEPVEIKSSERQTLEFRGRLEDFPLPVRGQGKYPGLVVRVRNVFNDGSPFPKQVKDDNKKRHYPPEPNLPTLQIHSVDFLGPVFDQWPPRSHRRLLPEFTEEETPANRERYTRAALREFMTLAFRRPVKTPELERLMRHYRTISPDCDTFEEAIRETFSMVLIQPSFLYLIEPSGNEKRKVTDWELASRLSYFLWSSMPDSRLRKLASKDELHNPKILRRETIRMLEDPRADAMVNRFADQWLKLPDLESIAVDKKVYPKFDNDLKPLMRRETQEYLRYLIRNNGSAIDLLSSDFVLVNQRLAEHYGIGGVVGTSYRRVAVEEASHRGGLLTQASVLMINSTGSDSHPIRRAVWIRDRLLNDPPAPPPPDVPSLEETDPRFRKLSVREQLEVHRSKRACSNCHRDIDPWGIALENFDATGLWRDKMRGHNGKQVPVKSSDVLPGDIQLSGTRGLKAHLLNNEKERFARSLVSRLLSYALGKGLELSDRDTVDDITQHFARNEYRMKDLVIRIVQSDAFRTK